MDFDIIAEQQGWSVQTMLCVLRDFLNSEGANERLAEFAQDVADKENE